MCASCRYQFVAVLDGAQRDLVDLDMGGAASRQITGKAHGIWMDEAASVDEYGEFFGSETRQKRDRLDSEAAQVVSDAAVVGLVHHVGRVDEEHRFLQQDVERADVS